MKRLTIIITLMVFTSGLFAANSLALGNFMDYAYKEKNPLPSIDQRIKINPETNEISEDVYMVLSKNSRVLNRSTQYLIQILNDQINWEYRTIIYSLHRQHGILDDLEMQKQHNKISK